MQKGKKKTKQTHDVCITHVLVRIYYILSTIYEYEMGHRQLWPRIRIKVVCRNIFCELFNTSSITFCSSVDRTFSSPTCGWCTEHTFALEGISLGFGVWALRCRLIFGHSTPVPLMVHLHTYTHVWEYMPYNFAKCPTAKSKCINQY